MYQFIKYFFFCCLTMMSLSLKTYCMNTAEDGERSLLATQKPLRPGDRVPDIPHTYWDPKGVRVERSLDIPGVWCIVVVPKVDEKESTAEIKRFVAVYKDKKHLLVQKHIYTLVIAHTIPRIMVDWGNSMKSDNYLLQFVADTNYKILHALGVLEKDPHSELVGKKSIFYFYANPYDDSKSILKNYEVVEKNDDNRTTLDRVESYYEQYFRNDTKDNWAQDYADSQKPPVIGASLHPFDYKAWKNHDIRGTLETHTFNPSGHFCIAVVPGISNSIRQILSFVDAYKDENHFLQKNRIPTFVVSQDNPDVMAVWAISMQSNPLLQFISDQKHECLHSLGVLERDPDAGLVGKRSIFFLYKNPNDVYPGSQPPEIRGFAVAKSNDDDEHTTFIQAIENHYKPIIELIQKVKRED